ncbi:hypothetical protein CRG98_011490 [Punica granatum]|uniref:Uncharacterized protein n=1 Tax=Punica granatum TaxID=22663 RepID=A0A2I0KHC4_PUNGR|nr:hypothetical protein CRG98_011490 [Punica granatum]
MFIEQACVEVIGRQVSSRGFAFSLSPRCTDCFMGPTYKVFLWAVFLVGPALEGRLSAVNPFLFQVCNVTWAQWLGDRDLDQGSRSDIPLRERRGVLPVDLQYFACLLRKLGDIQL